MHEKHKIEKKLKIEAARISAEHGNVPVVIIVGGSEAVNLPHSCKDLGVRHSHKGVTCIGRVRPET
jgi:hypothetical protein